MPYQAPPAAARIPADVLTAELAEYFAAVGKLLHVYELARPLSCDRPARRALIAGLRFFGLRLVYNVGRGPACVTHAATTFVAERNYLRALEQLNVAIARARAQRVPSGTQE
jgi:hypothetical protein